MGVNGWFNVYGDSALLRKESYFKNKRLGIDVSYDIYRASLGMKNIKDLTDNNGNPTILINVILCNVARYRKLGVKGLIYVFDNPTPNPYKIKESSKRNNVRKSASIKLDKEECIEVKQKLEKRIFTITDDMVSNVKKILTMLGVAWIIAPVGYEAEHLGAELTVRGMIDTFITSDSDTLLFGGKSMTRRIKKKGCKKYIYEEYILDDVLIDYGLNIEQLVHMGIVLGCDFADKTSGIGIGTILKKGLGVKLTDEQVKAKGYFMSECPFTNNQINRADVEKDRLIQWLVDHKNFNKLRVEKLLSMF